MAEGIIEELRAKKIKPRNVFGLMRRAAAQIENLILINAGLSNQLAAKSEDVRHHFNRAAELEKKLAAGGEPIPMRLPCPGCGLLHEDAGEFATKLHHTHACQACGLVWRPAIANTVGVRYLPGFKDDQLSQKEKA